MSGECKVAIPIIDWTARETPTFERHPASCSFWVLNKRIKLKSAHIGHKHLQSWVWNSIKVALCFSWKYCIIFFVNLCVENENDNIGVFLLVPKINMWKWYKFKTIQNKSHTRKLFHNTTYQPSTYSNVQTPQSRIPWQFISYSGDLTANIPQQNWKAEVNLLEPRRDGTQENARLRPPFMKVNLNFYCALPYGAIPWIPYCNIGWKLHEAPGLAVTTGK